MDEQALLRALEQGWIAGAALDVTEEEPLPSSSPLRQMENVILTPHRAASSVESELEMHRSMAESLACVVDGSWPPFPVFRDVVPRRPLKPYAGTLVLPHP